jgi:hypothetical protein
MKWIIIITLAMPILSLVLEINAINAYGQVINESKNEGIELAGNNH